MKFPIPLAELQQKQKQIMGGVYYRSALESNMQERLSKEADEIAVGLRNFLAQRVTVLKPPSGKVTVIDPQRSQAAPSQERTLKGEKKREDAAAKVLKDYGGDWDQVKDIARCTLVVEKAKDIERAFGFVKAHFTSVRTSYLKEVAPGRFDAAVGQTTSAAFKRSGLQFHAEKMIKPESNACGYSGYTIFVRSGGANANKGEIQINYPGMMYAKSLPEFEAALGKDKAREIGSRYSIVPGGVGHALYEVARAPGAEDTDRGKAYAAACKAYYDYFRSDPPSLALGAKAHEALTALMAPTKFPPPLTGVILPKLPAVVPPKPPSWLAESRRVWTQR